MQSVLSGDETGRSELRSEILAYLLKHSEAQDTVDGMVQWWLLERHIERETRRVQGVVAELANEGYLLERTGPDLRTHYRLNRERIDEIQHLLDKNTRV